MKLLTDSIFAPFTPRSFCFAEADAGGDDPAGGSGEPSDDDIAEAVIAGETDDAPTHDADDLEEAEFDGKKVKVTKGYKDALLREADYRQKTHVIGEEKRKVEADRNAMAQERQIMAQFDTERTELNAIDKRLAEYDKVTHDQWMAQRAADRANGTSIAEDGQFERDQLRSQKQKLLESMGAKYQTIQATAKQRQDAWEAENTKAIHAKIKDWSPEKEKAVKATMAEKFGFDPAMLAGVKDAPILAVMDYVHKQDQALAKARKRLAEAQNEQSRERQPEPVSRVRGNNAPAGRGATADTLKRSAASFDEAIIKQLYPGRRA